MPVNSERKEYTDACPMWCRMRDTFGGRDAIIRAGVKYVPELPGADSAGNSSYRLRGNFYNATKRTVQAMVGSVFQSPPDVVFPESLKEYLDDITLSNVSFEMFAQETGVELMLMARAGVLVDMPAPAPEGVGQGQSPRPYCVSYKAEDIVNWKTERQGGDEVLTMVVLREMATTPGKDEFTFDCVPQYRVVQLNNGICSAQLYRTKKDSSNEFLPFGSAIMMTRRGVPLNFVPFVFLSATKVTPEVESPPLLDLADVNLAHWRNSVDYEHGLHLVALPTPWVSGMQAAGTGPIKIGPSTVWELSVNGKAGMLEFNGTGLGAIVKAMADKEKQMAVLGARVLESAADVQETASAVRMRHAGEHANLRTVASSIEAGFKLVLQIVAWWAGTEDLPGDTDVNVELNKEYLNVKALALEVQVALTALQAGKISFDTWWNFLQTGGWGREGIDAAAEVDTIAKQKALAPEPDLNPDLSPSDIPPAAPAPKKKTITGPDGQVKYTITEHP